jgi:hypothetical protein
LATPMLMNINLYISKIYVLVISIFININLRLWTRRAACGTWPTVLGASWMQRRGARGGRTACDGRPPQLV